MPDKFNMQSPPFNRLTAEQQHQLRSALDVAYFRQRDVLIDAQHPVTHLHILIKGTVEERSPDGKEVFAHYANDDLFDVRAMFEELSKHQYMALEDTLSYLLPKSIFL
ncbi:cyclic nucleotide-binding domain-containing protein, partial [Klebsiella pneumoniae]